MKTEVKDKLAKTTETFIHSWGRETSFSVAQQSLSLWTTVGVTLGVYMNMKTNVKVNKLAKTMKENTQMG